MKRLQSEYKYFDGMLRLLGEGPKEDDDEDASLTCSICLGNVGKNSGTKSCITRCGHIFCYQCLTSWKQPKCPTCRTKISIEKDVFVVDDNNKDDNVVVKAEESSSSTLVKNQKYQKYGSKVQRYVLFSCIIYILDFL